MYHPTDSRQMYNPDTGNWVALRGGGEHGMNCQMDDDYMAQMEWDAEMEDMVADTTLPLAERLEAATRLAASRQRRAINKARYAAHVAAIVPKPIMWTESI